MQNEAVLVLGGSGRLGRMLRSFWPQPHDLVVQSRSDTADLPGFDILDQSDETVAIMREKRAVICLSGVTPAYAEAHGGEMALNTTLALAAVNAAAHANVPRVFLASSAAVYGAGGGPFREIDALAPVSEYGRAKVDMETQACALGAALKQPVTALRIGNVAGADAILGSWRPGMQIDQLADGSTPRRAYIGPRTLARVLCALTSLTDLPDVLNIAAPGTVAMGDLLDAAGLSWTPRRAPENVIPDVAFDTSALEQLVDFSPQDSDPAAMVAEWATMKGLP